MGLKRGPPRPAVERPPLHAVVNLIISGCGPAIAAPFTNPLDTARVNMQVRSLLLPSPPQRLTTTTPPGTTANTTTMQINGEGGGALAHKNTFACIRHLWRTEGMAGLQRGLTTAYFREFIQNVPRLGLYAPLVATIRRLDGTAGNGKADAFHQVHGIATGLASPPLPSP